MTFDIKRDQAIIGSLKVGSLSHFLAHTSLGDLTLHLRKDEDKYTFLLDAVPVTKDQNDLLKKLYGI